MEKLMIIGIAALIGLFTIIPGKPWVTPSETGPEPLPPMIENPVNQNYLPPAPCTD